MKRYLLFLAISFVLLLLFSGTTSPFYNLSFSDGLVFEYVALGLQHGQIPYIDIFDHKGPFIYFINYIGLLLGGRYGILFLQCINLATVLWLFFRKRISLWILPIVCLLLIQFFDSGNMTEEWSLLFLSIPIVFFSDVFSAHKIQMPYWQVCVIGFCFGLVALLRLNNVAPVFGMFLLWVVLLLRARQYQYLIRACALCFVCFCIPLAIACMWFYVKTGMTGLSEFFYANILFNLEYAQKPWPSETPLWKLIPAQFFYLSVIIISIVYCARCSTRHRLLIYGLLFSIVMTLVTMGRAHFSHYQMILIPTLILSLSIMYYYRQWVALALVVASGVFCMKYVYANKSDYFRYKELIEIQQQEFAQALQVIPASERSDSWNLNVDGRVDLFIQNELFPQSRFCIPWHRGYTQRFREEEADAFRHQTCRWVFVDENGLDQIPADAAYLFQHYTKVCDTTPDLGRHIVIYRLNE